MSKRVRVFSDYLPVRDHASPSVVLLKDRSALAILELDGLPVHTLDDDLVRRARDSLNHLLCGWSSIDDLVLYSWVCRGRAEEAVYPSGTFRSRFAADLDARYRARLLDRNLYLNRTYLGIMIRPPRIAGEWIGERIERRRRGRDVVEEPPYQRVRRLLDACDTIETNLATYKPRRLGLVQDARGRIFSEVGEALAFIMTGVWRRVGLQANNALGGLLTERFITGSETIEIRGAGYSHFAACFGALQPMTPCLPGALDEILTSPFYSTVTQSFRFIRRQDAIETMSSQQKRMAGADDHARSQMSQLSDALDAVQSGRLMMGDYHLVVTVFTDDRAKMRETANAAWHTLQNTGLHAAREDLALEAAYLSMMPGNGRYRPRPWVVSTSNFASLAGMHAFPSGDERGQWGAPIAMFRTLGGTPYRYHMHVNQVGNTFVFGESGSGKSTWLGFIILQSERAGAQVIVRDKDRGLEALIRAVGGKYLALDNPTGLAPLKALTDAPADLHHLAQLVRGLLCLPERYEMTPEEDRRLHVGLRAIMALPPKDRWIGDLRAFLGVRSGAGLRLEKWCWGNEYGWALDNPHDVVDIDAPVLGTDVTKFLDDPMVRGPVMMDLLYRTERLADGRRLLEIIDEGWKVIDDEAFSDYAKDMFKTDRKKNAAMIFATQSISDARESRIWPTIREQCKTIVAFAVDRPNRDDFRALKFSERECDIIEKLRPGTGDFLLRQGARSVQLQLLLSGMADEINVISGTALGVKALDKALAEIGDADHERLIEAYHEKMREDA